MVNSFQWDPIMNGKKASTLISMNSKMNYNWPIKLFFKFLNLIELFMNFPFLANPLKSFLVIGWYNGIHIPQWIFVKSNNWVISFSFFFQMTSSSFFSASTSWYTMCTYVHYLVLQIRLVLVLVQLP